MYTFGPETFTWFAFRMKHPLLWILTAVALSHCTINKDLLFKTPRDYTFNTFPDTLGPSAKLAPNNVLDFNFFTGNGHILVESGIGANTMLGPGAGMGMRQNQFLMQQAQLPYIIDRDGTVKLPVIGRVKLEGLTLRDAETKLEELYSQYYNEPFVLLSVNNNRVIVSPGAGGTAQVITLVNNNTTLIEALAMAGGVQERGNAAKIKLIRSSENNRSREIYQFDLSTIDGVKYADIIVQPNDIIYVEPLPLLAREFVQEIGPVVTLLTTVILLVTILTAN